MNRMSVSNRSVSTLPSGFLPVPVPCTSATPAKPLKSVIDDGSTPAWNGSTKWKATPLTIVVAGVGLGGATENDPADAAAGHSSPLPSEVPAAAAAAPPIKVRRESRCRAKCDSDSGPGGTGHPLLSMPRASMATAPQGRARPDKNSNTASPARTESSESVHRPHATAEHRGQRWCAVAALPDNEHAVAAPDQLPDHPALRAAPRPRAARPTSARP